MKGREVFYVARKPLNLIESLKQFIGTGVFPKRGVLIDVDRARATGGIGPAIDFYRLRGGVESGLEEGDRVSIVCRPVEE